MKNSLSKISKYTYPFFLGVSALAISLSSAYYSVYGLGALFAGAAIQIMIMAGSLEFAKVILAGFLYKFWKTLPTLIKGYLTVAVVFLVLISSMGIYGYLSAAYKDSDIRLASSNNNVELIQSSIQQYSDKLSNVERENNDLSQTILTLTTAISNNNIEYIDPETGTLVRTQSSASRRLIQDQLDRVTQRQEDLFNLSISYSDSLSFYKNKLSLANNSVSTTRDLGPLLFLSDVLGLEMDKVANIIIVFIMIVFDPLAITMIVATNVALAKVSDNKVQTKQKPIIKYKVMEIEKEQEQEQEITIPEPTEKNPNQLELPFEKKSSIVKEKPTTNTNTSSDRLIYETQTHSYYRDKNGNPKRAKKQTNPDKIIYM